MRDRTRSASAGARPLLRAILVLGFALAACEGAGPAADITEPPGDSVPSGPPPVYTFDVLASYPHDRSAFTQGLIYRDGVLYEGTGLNGRSTLRKVALQTGQVLQSTSLPAQYFGEGISVFGDEVVQLTWTSQVGFVYDLATLQLKRTFSYATEGWGITHDGTRYIMSDGTSTLYFRDPRTFAEIGRVQVRDDKGPVTRLNELEYVNGQVYANVWQTDYIARIDPATGRVTAWIDLIGLLPDSVRDGTENVLNGVAWDAAGDRLFVTGKLWPRLYEIRARPR